MSAGFRWTKVGSAIVLGAALLCAGSVNPASATTQQKRSKKQQQPPPPQYPSGPTGRPVQPIPLDATPAVPPLVTYENNQLTIVAPNSTLADILRAVRKQTGAEIEIPAAPERVVTNLGPGPARDVVAELLNGSRFNYVLLGSPADDAALTRIVLVAKSGPQDIPPPQPTLDPSLGPQANNGAQPDQPQEAEADAADENADDNNDQAEPEQPAQPADQNVKTPQQMLQEMQQRQMQLQQAQPPGQPPVPGAGRPPGAPQQQDQ